MGQETAAFRVSIRRGCQQKSVGKGGLMTAARRGVSLFKEPRPACCQVDGMGGPNKLMDRCESETLANG